MGASLMICLLDHVHADAAENARGAYKREDVIEVRTLASVWAEQERPPHVGRVNLRGDFDPAKVAKYRVEEHDTADGLRTATSARVRRRLFKLDLSLLGAASLTALETGSGVLDLAVAGGWTVFRAFLVNKKSGRSEAAAGVTEEDLA